MGSATSSPAPASKPAALPSNPSLITELNPEGLKPCCACPDTKSARDQCFMGSEKPEIECKQLVEAHIACMKGCLRLQGLDV
ncbi:cox17-domain-containing protein [Phaffia rhodozyma]|uniref:Cox17-domain-containing protein n=1 Tax=Phaffia rhodozyma TaxID=264483 RepID=A0A0F7SF25_PHARH|nr:cox17-domain-containing protein [Phaffia rhodozyma]